MIRLVKLSMAHLKHVMRWVNDPQVTQYFAGLQKAITEEQERGFLEKLIASPTDKVFSVFDGRKYIGQVSVNQIHWPSGEGRLFLVITRKHQGKGYAKDIVHAIQDKAFGELGLHRIYLIVREDKRRSVQLYHKCGFRQEGVLYDKYKIGGAWINMLQMAIIEPWWKTWWKERG